MLLEEFVNRSPQGYIKAERYLNDGSPSGFSEINTTSEYTRPKSPTATFNLKRIKFSQDIFVEDIGIIKPGYIDERCIFIHPDMLDSIELMNHNRYSIEGDLVVAPTASGRTVIAIEKNYFVKLAYLGYLGRLVRHMNGEIVRSACEVTNQLIKATKTDKLNCKFSFLREDYGRVVHIPVKHLTINDIELPQNGNGCYELGLLFRESKPFPYVQEDEFLIPFFALFSQEYDPISKKILTSQDKPLLIQLFEKQNESMEDFLLNRILFPLFHTYFDALIYAGVELEAHAQNMLLTIDKDFRVMRIVCRDLESAGRDVPVMEYMGIDYVKHGSYKYNIISPVEPGQKYAKYYINHSFMFDFKLGEYTVAPLIKLAHQYASFNDDVLINRIKAFNRQFIDKLPRRHFPSDWCYYENLNWSAEQKPRKYIWKDNPKYR